MSKNKKDKTIYINQLIRVMNDMLLCNNKLDEEDTLNILINVVGNVSYNMWNKKGDISELSDSIQGLMKQWFEKRAIKDGNKIP